MIDKWNKIGFSVGDGYDTPFKNSVNVYQDGTVPFSRDGKGRLFAIAGHSHMGEIAIFRGDNLFDMKKVYPAETDFAVGAAGKAFSGVRYPEGVRSRGSVWPFGLYICPVTNRFFCFFHNETGWNGQGTAYDAFGLCERPKYDSDFRHVGMMHSDDEGRTWTFDRWVLTAEKVCYTERFRPEPTCGPGQSGDVVSLGSGDFSCYVEPNGEFIYILYNVVGVDVASGVWTSCDVCVARTRKRTDGTLGDFVKYYDGAFCEAGNLGRETPVLKAAWHARAEYFGILGGYVVSYSPVNVGDRVRFVSDRMEMRPTADFVGYGEPVSVFKDGKPFGNHYHAILPLRGEGDPFVVEGDAFTVLTGNNGTDVVANDFTLEFK